MLTKTATQLLEDLADPANEVVWREFDDRYRPIILNFVRRLGLGNEDAADVAQETLARFVWAYREGGYERQRGRLRSWLIGIARNCVVDLVRKRAARRGDRGDSALIDLPQMQQLEDIWSHECEEEILRRALRRLREETRFSEKTIEAFEMIALRECSASEVAGQLDMSLNDVYLAKNRCLKKLREIVKELDVAYEIEDGDAPDV